MPWRRIRIRSGVLAVPESVTVCSPSVFTDFLSAHSDLIYRFKNIQLLRLLYNFLAEKVKRFQVRLNTGKI
jgi:hypothetical protein